ncbi:hypothetical protein [sulfur-oxidizing endosymbiont of Gigantopelta aegis]|uniref:hypothetical protein n=1 Tax=sulfur-oxidizing endosymbiont of Gigantopelta aegis TaxID=2794934 RepID=UPI0031B5A255
MVEAVTQVEHPFMEKFNGRLIGVLRWEQLNELWVTIQTGKTDDWFIYHIGEAPPVTACKPEKLHHFVEEIDKLLKHDHEHDYCGIVYADDKDAPTFIKIYDPNNLGHVCGSSGAPPPLPGWILSKVQPIDLEVAIAPLETEGVGGRKFLVRCNYSAY